MRFLPPFFFFPSPWISISDPIRILPVGVCKRQVEDVEYTIDHGRICHLASDARWPPFRDHIDFGEFEDSDDICDICDIPNIVCRTGHRAPSRQVTHQARVWSRLENLSRNALLRNHPLPTIGSLAR